MVWWRFSRSTDETGLQIHSFYPKRVLGERRLFDAFAFPFPESAYSRKPALSRMLRMDVGQNPGCVLAQSVIICYL